MSPPRRLLVVDPGKVTGWVVWDQGSRQLEAGEHVAEAFLDLAWARLLEPAPEATLDGVVCEAFIIGPGTLRVDRGANWSLEQIGALRLLARRAGAFFLLQPPASRRAATDERLQAAGLWVPGGHARDAARHLLIYLLRAGLGPPGGAPNPRREV